MMDVKKKFKLANITFASLTILFILLAVLSGVFSLIEKNKDVAHYKETSDISYVINSSNGTYTEEDNISFAAAEINEIVVIIEYFNNNKDNRGTLEATKRTYIKSEDTPYGVFGPVEYVVEELVVSEDKTTITYTIPYQEYQNRAKNYVASHMDADTTAVGKLDLLLVATSKDESKKEALVSISLLEDVLTVSISKTMTTNESILDSNYKMLLIVAVGCVFVSVCSGVCFVVSYKLSKMDKYTRNLFVIFKLNKGILVESDLASIEDGFVVTSFKELLKVQNSVSLPIMYSKSEDNVRFVIKAGNSVYSYTITK